MDATAGDTAAGPTGASERRAHVLQTSLGSFARFGYRKTAMEEVARAADISRPGLYYLFPSKQELFRAAVEWALEADVTAAERALADTGRPIADRLLEAFDRWTGRYIGPLTRDIATVIQDNPGLLGSLTVEYPARFAAAVTAAITEQFGSSSGGSGGSTAHADRADDADTAGGGAHARDAAQALLSISVGIKHQVDTREEFLERLRSGIRVVLR
jgi:AcrR family transcriptional regulator